MKLNVLGTEYEIKENDKLSDLDGTCDTYKKEISVKPTYMMLDSYASDEDKEIRVKETKRHELIHAFFNESGLGSESYCEDEVLVDWIAIQFPKLIDAFKEAGAL